jgi:hypothetical protein
VTCTKKINSFFSLWAYYQEVLPTLIDQHQLDGKLLDAALHKDKKLKVT